MNMETATTIIENSLNADRTLQLQWGEPVSGFIYNCGTRMDLHKLNHDLINGGYDRTIICHVHYDANDANYPNLYYTPLDQNWMGTIIGATLGIRKRPTIVDILAPVAAPASV